VKNILISATLLLQCTIALAVGGPTRGKIPAPDKHILVHEFINHGYKSQYTELFTNVFVDKDNLPSAQVVMRSNDGFNGEDFKRFAVMPKPCSFDDISGDMRIYSSETEFKAYKWSRVVPAKWDNERRIYRQDDVMTDVLATEICLQTNQGFMGYLHGEVIDRVKTIIEAGEARGKSKEAAILADTSKKEMDDGACNARRAEVRRDRADATAVVEAVESRSTQLEIRKAGIEMRRALINSFNGGSPSYHAEVLHQFNADVGASNAEAAAIRREHQRASDRMNKVNLRVDSFNEECNR
jgi:hypothetical protein